MNDIRLKTMPFELDGKTYLLRSNMNVIADVQEAFGGSLTPAFGGQATLKSALVILAAMLNDYADEQGWRERFTARSLGRRFGFNELPLEDIIKLFVSGLIPEDAIEASTAEEPSEKN